MTLINNIIKEELNQLNLKPNISRSSGLGTNLVYLSIDRSYANAYANGETSAAHVYRFPINNGVLFYICLSEEAEHFGGDVWISGFKDEIISDIKNYASNNNLSRVTKDFLELAQYDIDNMTTKQINSILELLQNNNLSIISPLDWSDLQESEQGYSEVCVKSVKPNEIIKVEIYQNGELINTIKGAYNMDCEIPFYHGSPLNYWQHLL